MRHFPIFALLAALLGPAPLLAQGEWAGRDEAFQLAAYARVASEDEEAASIYAEAADALEEGNLQRTEHSESPW